MITQMSKFFFWAFWLLLAGLATGCTSPPAPMDCTGAHCQPSGADEQMLWQKSEEEQRAFESGGLLYPDPDLEDYLNQLAVKLQPQPADLKIRVKVIKNTQLNAFAYPNGMIYMHTGLLAAMDNEAQLAAVLAHEITHCTHRHALKAFKKLKDQPAILRAFRRTLSETKGLQRIAGFMGISGTVAAVSEHIRELEAEADRVGIALMAKAGYDPREALLIFDKMTSEMETQGLEESPLGSHPTVRQRVADLQNLIGAQYPHNGMETRNEEIFLAKLIRLFLDNAELDIRGGRFQAARSGLDKHLRIRPDGPRAYFLLGEIYRQRKQDGDTLKALAFYNRAVSLDPDFASAHKAIGLIHYKEGRLTLARKFFESCMQLAPDSPDKAYIQEYLKQCPLSEEG